MIEYSTVELTLIRQALDVIQIHGKDAKFIADLQFKIDNNIFILENPVTPNSSS